MRGRSGRDRRGEVTPGDVRRTAMDLLARREHARAELERKLMQRGYEPDMIGPVLDDLAHEGLQSDRRYAEALVASAVARGKGPAHARHKLRQSGVDAAVVEFALEACDVDWLQLARRARARRFGEAVPVEFRERSRQARFLYQRGFDSDTIHRLLGG